MYVAGIAAFLPGGQAENRKKQPFPRMAKTALEVHSVGTKGVYLMARKRLQQRGDHAQRDDRDRNKPAVMYQLVFLDFVRKHRETSLRFSRLENPEESHAQSTQISQRVRTKLSPPF